MNKPYYFGYWLYATQHWEYDLKASPFSTCIKGTIIDDDNDSWMGGFYGIELSSDMVTFLRLKYENIILQENTTFIQLNTVPYLPTVCETLLSDIIENLNHNDN